MTVESADGRYGYRAWDRRPGDGVDPSVMLDGAQTVAEVAMLNPVPLPSGYQPRLMGTERTQPGIVDVLGVGPVPLMTDTATRQESGMQPTGVNW